MKMPTFNIFITMASPEDKKAEKKEKKKDNLLAKALKKSNDSEDDMLTEMKTMNDKLRRLPMTSHTGGG